VTGVVVELTTARLRLRPWSADELDAFHQVWSDPKTIWWGPSTSLDESRRVLEKVLSQSTWWAVRLGNEVIGNVFLRLSPRRPEVLELGYHFRSTCWGNGYATEAARAVLATAPAVVVEASVVPDNERSRQVVKRLGFSVAAQIVHAGRNHDLWERAGRSRNEAD
jgi:RimJ/RimL family protein N-acetyltransferase